MIKYKAGYKYQLAEDYQVYLCMVPEESICTEYIDLYSDGRLVIRRGYAWDGPSGPTIDTKTFMRGSLVHDAIYQLLREGHLPQNDCGTNYRKLADYELKRACLKDGMAKVRAFYVYWSVRLFANAAASIKSKRQVFITP